MVRASSLILGEESASRKVNASSTPGSVSMMIRVGFILSCRAAFCPYDMNFSTSSLSDSSIFLNSGNWGIIKSYFFYFSHYTTI